MPLLRQQYDADHLQLDIQVGPAEGKYYLEKYDLKADDAILAQEKHMAM